MMASTAWLSTDADLGQPLTLTQEPNQCIGFQIDGPSFSEDFVSFYHGG